MASATFPGSTYLIAAKEALQHLERNLPEIERIFTKFQIPKSDYHLLAGFDEYLLQEHSGYLDEIHILIRFETPDMAALLSHLAPILAPFPALIVTDKSFHCLPSSVADLNAIARTMIHRFTDNIETTREISSSISLSKNVDTGGSSSQNASDSGKGSEPYPTPEPPEIDGSWNSKIAFNIVSDLHDPSKPQGIQTLQLQGKLMIERTSETPQPQQFATCRTEFTELQTMTLASPGNLAYRHFHLAFSIDSHQEVVNVEDIRPRRTQKYNQESKASSPTPSTLAMIGPIIPQLTVRTGAIRTGGQVTSIEKTVSRIKQIDISGIAEWTFYITDTFGGIALSPDKLPHACFKFIGETDIPAPPPTHMDIKISTFWTLSGNPWRNLEGTTSSKPTYSNICKVVKLEVPSNLRGSQIYDANLKVSRSADQG